MAKFYGKIGFAISKESLTNPGIWEDEIIEKTYYGDVLKNTRNWQSNTNTINDDLVVHNSISIIGDQFAYKNLYSIKYVEWMSHKWKVKSIDVENPRLILGIEGVYNG